MIPLKRYLAAFTGLLLISACNSTPLKDRFSCTNSDWYEIGRRDGASGMLPDRINFYFEKCGGNLERESVDMYQNGRNAGLVEFCTSRNGFELGRMHVAYNSVCPGQMEQAFLKSYEKGSRARLLEQENKRLSLRMDQLTRELSSERKIASDQQSSLLQELEAAKKKRAQNDREISKISESSVE